MNRVSINETDSKELEWISSEVKYKTERRAKCRNTSQVTFGLRKLKLTAHRLISPAVYTSQCSMVVLRLL